LNFWQQKTSLDNNNFLISQNRQYSFSQAFDESDQIFESCDRDVVLILCNRDFETVFAYIGALRKNLVPILVDSEIKQGALNTIFKAYKPGYVFTDQSEKFLDFECDQEKIFSVGKYSLLKFKSNKKILRKDLAVVLLTSGSTGDPKSVRISNSNLEIATNNITKYLNLKHYHRSLSLLPFHYSYGLSVLHNAIYSRSSIFVTEDTVFDKKLWKNCVDFEITDISAVPFTLEIVKRLKLDDRFYENLRCLTQAGGRLDVNITKYFLDLSESKSFDYYTMYGQTEASPRISYIPPKMAKEKLGTVGIPLECGEVFIDELGNKSGEGELIYTGPNVCLGYAESDLDLCKADELNGILRTGDIARIDAEGYITIIGRKKRFIKLKGISVNLDYVESLINSHEISCYVIGRDDSLIILLKKENFHNNEQKVKEIISNNFNFHNSLISIHEDDLPTLSSGKPDYKNLVEKYL